MKINLRYFTLAKTNGNHLRKLKSGEGLTVILKKSDYSNYTIVKDSETDM